MGRLKTKIFVIKSLILHNEAWRVKDKPHISILRNLNCSEELNHLISKPTNCLDLKTLLLAKNWFVLIEIFNVFTWNFDFARVHYIISHGIKQTDEKPENDKVQKKKIDLGSDAKSIHFLCVGDQIDPIFFEKKRVGNRF